MLFVVTGPSGSGKSTLIGQVMRDARTSGSRSPTRPGPAALGEGRARLSFRLRARRSSAWSGTKRFVEMGRRPRPSLRDLPGRDRDKGRGRRRRPRHRRPGGPPDPGRVDAAVLVFVMPPVVSGAPATARQPRRGQPRRDRTPPAERPGRRSGPTPSSTTSSSTTTWTGRGRAQSIIRAARLPPGRPDGRGLDAILRSFAEEDRP